MIVPVMAISNLVLTQQIYSEETNGAHAHYREPVPLTMISVIADFVTCTRTTTNGHLSTTAIFFRRTVHTLTLV